MRCHPLPVLVALLAGAGSTLASPPATQLPDLRVQVQQITYQIAPDGSAKPIDHQVLDVFDVALEKQYDSIDRTAGGLKFGLVYFEVPRDGSDQPNYNLYLYMRDRTHEVVADGYRNNDVPGALFKLTTMLMEREGDKAYARLMHCVAPQSGPPSPGEAAGLDLWQVRRQLDDRVAALLARR